MLSTDLDLRVAVRRAALRQALRSGRGLDIVRAADRLRLDGANLGGRALLDIRDTRGRLGRAMRAARRRRLIGDAAATPTALTASSATTAARRRSRRRWILAALVALVILGLVLLFLLWPAPDSQEEPGGGLPPLQQQVQQVVQKEILRGRSVFVSPSPQPTPVAVAQPSLTPLPQIPFTTQRPNPSSGSGGVPGGTGSGTGGSGTGTGAGTGSGSGSGPKPTQPPPPPSIPPGFGRLTIVVQDQYTGALLPDVCLVVGSGSCEPGKPHTDGAGRWWVDLPVSQPNTNFDVTFIMQGYATDYRRFVVLKGQSVTYVVRLTPTGDKGNG